MFPKSGKNPKATNLTANERASRKYDQNLRQEALPNRKRTLSQLTANTETSLP